MCEGVQCKYKKIPGNFFAGLYKQTEATYFEVPEAEQKVPEVKF